MMLQGREENFREGPFWGGCGGQRGIDPIFELRVNRLTGYFLMAADQDQTYSKKKK